MSKPYLERLRYGALPAVDGGLAPGTDGALHLDIDEGRTAAVEGSVEGVGEVGGLTHVQPLAAEGLDEPVVPDGQEVGGHGLAVDLKLNLPVDAPRRVVAQHCRDGDAVPHGGVVLQRVEAERAVA